MSDTLYAIPDTITAGTTVVYQKTLPDYPTATWAITLYLAGASVANTVAVETSPDLYVFTLTAAVTAGLTPGTYRWLERAVSSTVTEDIASGVITVLPNIATATAGSLQTHNEKTLTVIDAALYGRLGTDMQSYSIAGRAVSKIPVEELLRLQGIYRARVWAERNPGYMGQTVNFQFTGGPNS